MFVFDTSKHANNFQQKNFKTASMKVNQICKKVKNF